MLLLACPVAFGTTWDIWGWVTELVLVLLFEVYEAFLIFLHARLGCKHDDMM